MPRRVFVRSPLQRKPIYVDLESSTLLRVLARFVTPAAEHAPTAPILFTEMLPGAEDCWLEDSNGRYTSELRIVAVDTSRPPRRATPLAGSPPHRLEQPFDSSFALNTKRALHW